MHLKITFQTLNTIIKCSKRVEIANLQLSTWNFFEPHFYDQINVLSTTSSISDDIAAIWKSLMYTQKLLINSMAMIARDSGWKCMLNQDRERQCDFILFVRRLCMKKSGLENFCRDKSLWIWSNYDGMRKSALLFGFKSSYFFFLVECYCGLKFCRHFKPNLHVSETSFRNKF